MRERALTYSATCDAVPQRVGKSSESRRELTETPRASSKEQSCTKRKPPLPFETTDRGLLINFAPRKDSTATSDIGLGMRLPAVTTAMGRAMIAHEYPTFSLFAARFADAIVTPDTLFELGSISKIFTATLAAWAEQQGKLDLSETAAHYLCADTCTIGDKIILMDLATHHSGGLPLQVLVAGEVFRLPIVDVDAAVQLRLTPLLSCCRSKKSAFLATQVQSPELF